MGIGVQNNSKKYRSSKTNLNNNNNIYQSE